MRQPQNPRLALLTAKRFLVVACGTWAVLGIVSTANSENTSWMSDVVRDRLRSRIESAVSSAHIEIGNERIHATTALPRFYERRGFRPAWIDDSGSHARLDSLVQAIKAVKSDGLNPDDYHLKKIERALASAREKRKAGEPPDPGLETDLELLATDAFLICGSHLLAGRVNPESIEAEWFSKSRERDIVALLDSATVSRKIRTTLSDLLPNQRGYFWLRDRLREYRRIASEDGWPAIPSGPALRAGDRDDRVTLMRRRLTITADWAASGPVDSAFYDKDLESAVIRFQERHGLETDGVVGMKTVTALNVPVESRIEQIAINLERWRWLQEDLGNRHILVNIANFELDVVEAENTVITMRVIVGRPYRRTPVFSDRMTYLVLNPYWNVPRSLALRDIVPQVRKSPDHLVKQKITVLSGWGAEMRVVDPATVNWATASGVGFPYWFRQEPGPQNLLGRIKFMFPNPHNVYLHDTPTRNLFAKTERGFSSGCIRVEDPIGLAEYVLTGDSKWDRASILAALERVSDQTVSLPTPIPIHLLYWTAWVTPTGEMHFRDDIYQRDASLAQALTEPPPAPR